MCQIPFLVIITVLSNPAHSESVSETSRPFWCSFVISPHSEQAAKDKCVEMCMHNYFFAFISAVFIIFFFFFTAYAKAMPAPLLRFLGL